MRPIRNSRGAWRSLFAALALFVGVRVHDAPRAFASGSLIVATDAAVRALGTLPVRPGAMVVATKLATDQPATRGDDLAVRIAGLVAGRIGNGAKAHGGIATLTSARSLARNHDTLVYVQASLVKGELRVTLDAYPVPSNGWDRVRAPLSPPKGHGFASAPFDAEVRSFLTPILLEQAKVHVARHDEGEVLAAACGDLDGDGGMELALVSRARVAVGHIRAGVFVPMRVVPWTKLAGRAAVPLREPLAGAMFGPSAASDRDRFLYVGTSDRGAVVLDSELNVKDALYGLPVAFMRAPSQSAVCSSPNAALGAFDGPIGACVRNALPQLEAPASVFDVFAGSESVAANGKIITVLAAREPSGKLRIKMDDAPVRTLDDAGAQVVVGDLDLDGTPEIVSSASTDDDFIAVQSATGVDLKMRLRIAAPAGVRALAICPPEERGMPVLAAVVGNEVWLVR
jgi:hypothetical protein